MRYLNNGKNNTYVKGRFLVPTVCMNIDYYWLQKDLKLNNCSKTEKRFIWSII